MWDKPVATDRKYQPGAKTPNWQGISNMAQETPGGIVRNLGTTTCLTRKDAFGISLHAVHGSPFPSAASPGGARLPLERAEGLGSEAFASPAVLVRPTGKENPLLAPWGTSNSVFSQLCARGVSLVFLRGLQPRGRGAAGNQDLGNCLLIWPRAGHSASSHPFQHPHPKMYSLTALLSLWLRLCRAWLSSELSQLGFFVLWLWFLVLSFSCLLGCLNANVGIQVMVYTLPRSVLLTWKCVDVNYWQVQLSTSLIALSYTTRSPGFCWSWCYRCGIKITTF